MPLNIDELTFAQIKEVAALLPAVASKDSTPAFLTKGRKVFIRTVTLYFTGEIVSVGPREIELKDAAWIADTKRFADFLAAGPTSETEIEPYPDGVVINREVIIDISPWKHSLPREQT